MRDASHGGFTLVELLVTLTIMSTAMIAIFTGLTTLYKASAVQRSNANLDAVSRTYVERLGSAPYVACAATYPAVSLPSGFSFASGPTITYWQGDNPATFASSCSAGSDRGAQQVAATVREDGTGQVQRLVVAKRS